MSNYTIKFGSRDLINVLYEHGYTTVSYDEVLRFLKSAAKYVCQCLHQTMGLTTNVGLIFGWYDNFDLLVSTPNDCRGTHAMATEFQMHPAGIIETGSSQLGISTLTIPRLTPKQVKSVNNKSKESAALQSPKTLESEVCALQISLEAAQKERCRVAQYPHEGARCNGVEWFQQSLSQESECSETCEHIHVWSIN